MSAPRKETVIELTKNFLKFIEDYQDEFNYEFWSTPQEFLDAALQTFFENPDLGSRDSFED